MTCASSEHLRAETVDNKEDHAPRGRQPQRIRFASESRE